MASQAASAILSEISSVSALCGFNFVSAAGSAASTLLHLRFEEVERGGRINH
jgi:hypothetical protein